jgi:predicted methyltransferase
MEELLELSKEMACNRLNRGVDIAREVAQWALPGDEYNATCRKFEGCGLSLDPFEELISYTSQFCDISRAYGSAFGPHL